MTTRAEAFKTALHQRHILAVLVDNEFGVLARVVGLFSGRGYNIESLTVAEVDHDRKLSRITIVTSGPETVISQIVSLLERLVPVHRVEDLTLAGAHVERELALIKVVASGQARVEALRIVDAFNARVVDATVESFVFEITASAPKVNSFVELMRPLGMVEVARTGVVGMQRGASSLKIEDEALLADERKKLASVVVNS